LASASDETGSDYTGRALVLNPVLRGDRDRDVQARLDESVALARAIELDVIHGESVNLNRPRPATLLGTGLIERFADLVKAEEADVVVISEENYCLGAAREDHDIAGLNGARLRTHGGFSEQNVPFVISQPLNADYARRASSEQLRNYHIFDFAINGTAKAA